MLLLRESGEVNRLKGGYKRQGEAVRERQRKVTGRGGEWKSQARTCGVNSGGRSSVINLQASNTLRNYIPVCDEIMHTYLKGPAYLSVARKCYKCYKL